MDLLAALQTAWAAASAVVAAVPNGLHVDEAPENTPLPFAVVSQVDGDTDALFGGQLPCEVTIDFTVFHESQDGALSAIELVAAAFDGTTPGTGGYFSNRITAPIVHRTPHGYGVGWNAVERNASANPVYQASITYVFGMDRA